MEAITVSIIIPVYNTERYLARCLNSIVSQTYRDIEIIIVDDGSPDNSKAIYERFAQQDNRIVVFKQNNAGLSEARNAGLNISHGQYITFIDSDDYVAGNYIETLLNLCVENDCGIAQCAFVHGTHSDYNFNKNTNKEVSIYTRDNMFSDRKLKIVAWGKLYRSDVIRDMRFEPGKIYEDEFYTYRAFYEAKRVAVTSVPLYYYYKDPESQSRRPTDLINIDFIEAYHQRMDFFRKKGEKRLLIISQKELCLRLALLYAQCKKNVNNKNDLDEIIAIFKRNYNELAKTHIDGYSLKERLVLMTFRSFPNLTAAILNLLR